MIRKSIHHFNRGIVIGVEIMGAVAFVIFLIWCGLLWRLSQGPLSVDFLTGKLEQTLNEQQSGFIFHVGATQLTWGGNLQPIDVEMQNVQIMRQDSTPVLAIEKIGVQVSKRNLVFGRIVPTVIKINGPAMRVIRGEDGRFNLNLGAPTAETAVEEPLEAEPEKDHVALVKNLLKQLEESRSSMLLGGLDEIRISNAAIFYEDKILDVAWRARKSGIVFARSKGGIAVSVLSGLDMGENKESIVRANLLYSWNSKETTAEVYFSDFVPAYAAQQSEKLRDLSGVELALKGKVSFKLDPDFKLGLTEFIIGADPGKFNAFNLYPEPLPVQGLYMSGQYDGRKGAGGIDQLKINLGGPQAEIQARFLPDEKGTVVIVRASLDNMPMDDLHKFWSEKLTPDPRAWIIKHLSAGIADRATLDAEFVYMPDAEKKVAIRELGGVIDFHGIKVDYFPPLMPVLNATGKATYDAKAFNIETTGGSLGNMSVTKSVIRLTDLDKSQTPGTHAKIDIVATVKGPVATALGVLDSKPLEYPTKLGLNAADVGGDAEVEVSFNFPIYKALRLDEVLVKADAKLNDVRLADIVSGMPLTGGPMELKLDGGTLSVKGKGKLENMPVTFDWLKNFNTGADVAARVSAQLPLDAAALKKFGIPDDMGFGGTIPANVTYTLQHDKTARLVLKGDVKNAVFGVPVAEFQKPMGDAGTVDLMLLIKNGKPEMIKDLNLATEKTDIRGDIEFRTETDGSYGFSKAILSHVRMGNTKLALTVSNMRSGGYELDVKGDNLDVSQLFTDNDKPGSDAEAAKKTTPVKLKLAVKRLVTGKDKFVDNVKLYLHRNTWKRIEQLEVDGFAGGKPIYLRYMPVGKGHSLRFEADNAGAALSAFGFTNAVRGGKLAINGTPNQKSGARDLAGTATLTNFTLREVPVLAKLLNAISVIGIVDLLNNSGIAFKKARVDFSWIDRGQPDSNANMRIIKLRNGQTSGASLGLTFEGNIDNWKQVYDLNGTIIPVSDISKIISIIPIVGDVLTAGGEGIFAFTYSIKGPKDQPTVMVNPLAALAPGILRKIFFEN